MGQTAQREGVKGERAPLGGPYSQWLTNAQGAQDVSAARGHQGGAPCPSSQRVDVGFNCVTVSQTTAGYHVT